VSLPPVTDATAYAEAFAAIPAQPAAAYEGQPRRRGGDSGWVPMSARHSIKRVMPQIPAAYEGRTEKRHVITIGRRGRDFRVSAQLKTRLRHPTAAPLANSNIWREWPNARHHPASTK